MIAIRSDQRMVARIGLAAAAIACCSLAIAPPARAQKPVASQSAPAKDLPRVEEVLKRAKTEGSIGFKTATGAFVMRTYNFISKADDDALVANVRKALEESKKSRIANDAKFGLKTDVAALDAQNKANLAELIGKLPGRDLQTIAARYWQTGKSYRAEEMKLPNDANLERLRDDLKNRKIAFEPSFIRTWNGKQYAAIVGEGPLAAPNAPSLKKGRTEPIATTSERNDGAVPGFTTYAREGKSALNFVDLLLAGGYATASPSRTWEGENAVALKLVFLSHASVKMEATLLPDKGYSLYSACTKMPDGMASREEYRDFVQTSAGFWLPTKMTMEDYRLNEHHASYLSSKIEAIAFELPKTNVELDPAIFDLASSKQFRSLPSMKIKTEDKR